MSPDTLNRQFALDDELTFVSGEGGFIFAEIANRQASARICTYAGQLLAYKPHGQTEDLLFVSAKAFYQPGKAIKGGIPVCWPWFGEDPEGKRPAHGFVRNRPWQVTGSGSERGETTWLEMTAPDDPASRALWTGLAELRIRIEIGAQLRITLSTRNLGEQPLQITQALHSYFLLGDIADTALQGLHEHRYLDKRLGMREQIQHTPLLRVDDEVDRIYTGVQDSLIIHDAALGRRIHIDAAGSHSAVVWNPWIEKSAAMTDFADDDYLRMLCVETANAGPDRITLDPGDNHKLQASIRVSTD
jgi:glucose-6-phosphate 1-epimerase